MVRQIIKTPAKILSKIAKPIVEFDANLKKIVQDLKDTHISLGGLGLAAPQINESKRVILIAAKKKPIIIMINPELLQQFDEQDSHEGCFSVPGVKDSIIRPKQVIVRYFTIDKLEKTVILEDDEARIFCHENDHLNGILFTDYL